MLLFLLLLYYVYFSSLRPLWRYQTTKKTLLYYNSAPKFVICYLVLNETVSKITYVLRGALYLLMRLYFGI